MLFVHRVLKFECLLYIKQIMKIIFVSVLLQNHFFRKFNLIISFTSNKFKFKCLFLPIYIYIKKKRNLKNFTEIKKQKKLYKKRSQKMY